MCCVTVQESAFVDPDTVNVTPLLANGSFCLRLPPDPNRAPQACRFRERGFCFSELAKERVLFMTTAPAITVTRLDLKRLENLLDSLEDFGPAAEALDEELARANVVAPEEVPPQVVTMNSRVHCREEGSGKDYHLTLVYPQDARTEGNVSVLAPMGSALLGLSVGQRIDWPTPAGKQIKLTLLDVEYQPEAAGDFNR